MIGGDGCGFVKSYPISDGGMSGENWLSHYRGAMRDGWRRSPRIRCPKTHTGLTGRSLEDLTLRRVHVRLNSVRANRLQTALDHLGAAVTEAQNALAEMRAESDPLAAHIFVSRRQYRNMHDTKGGKRHATVARMSWQTACDLGFRGSLGEWERLMGAAARR